MTPIIPSAPQHRPRSVIRRCLNDGVLAAGDEKECHICFGADWRYECARHSHVLSSEGCPECAYSFGGELFFEPVPLAVALNGNWTLAVASISSRPLFEWARESLGDEALASQLERIMAATELTAQQQLCLTLVALDPSRSLCWLGTEIDGAWLRENVDTSYHLLTGPLPRMAAELFGDRILLKLSETFERAVHYATAADHVFSAAQTHVLAAALGAQGNIPLPQTLAALSVLPPVCAERIRRKRLPRLKAVLPEIQRLCSAH